MNSINIRPLTEDDIQTVLELVPAHTPSIDSKSIPDAANYLRQVIFESPWRDDDFPSLIAAGPDGRPEGVITVFHRLMRWNGKPIHVAQPANFYVRPGPDGRRDPLLAAKMLRRVLNGKQDLTISDTGNDISRTMWERCGGAASELYSLSWVRPIRPLQAAVRMVEAGTQRGIPASRILRMAASMMDLAATPVFRRMGNRSALDAELEDFDIGVVVETLQTVRGYSLVPDYDRTSLGWLLDMAARKVDASSPRKFVVRNRHGQRIGWFVYVLGDTAVADVLQLFAIQGEEASVMRALIRDADERGAVLLRGRVEPGFMRSGVSAYRKQLCMLWDGAWMLLHSRRTELVDAFFKGQALFSPLEGEQWTAFNRIFGL